MSGSVAVRVGVVGVGARAVSERLEGGLPDGFDTWVAADRATALDAVAEGNIDGIVCTTEGDGCLDFLRAIRERGGSLPVVCYVSGGNEATAVEAFRAGASDYVRAAEGPEVLAERVAEAVGTTPATTVDANESLLTQDLVGVYLIQDERFHYVNDALCSVFGYERETLLNDLTPLDLVVEDDRGRLRENLDRRQRGEVTRLQYTLTGVRADGNHIDLVVHGQRVEHRGRPAVLGVLLDVTEQTRLAAEQELLSALVNDISRASDFDGALSAALRAVCETTDWEYGEAWLPDEEGESLERAGGWTDAEGLAAFAETSEDVRFGRGEGLPGRVFEGGEVEWLDDASAAGPETFHRNAAAESAGLHTAIGVPATADGEVVAVLVFLTRAVRSRDDRLLDIVSLVGVQTGALLATKRATDRLARERGLLDRLFETSPIGIVVLDTDGNVERANSRAETTLGLTESEMTGRAYDASEWEIVDEAGDPIDGEELPFARALATGEPVIGFEHAVRTPDGEQRWLSINAAPVTVDGGIQRVVTTVEDITERREREAELRAERDRLEEFASIVSHDLRNPLGIATGYTELTRETGDLSHLDAVERAHERMDTLIEDLLALARFGRSETPLSAVSLAGVAREAWEIAGREPATLTVAGDRQLLADRGRLQQLFENLFRNSVEHGSSDGDPTAGSVAVEVGPLEEGFYVQDDGPGIPVELREGLFDRGVSGGGGTGLGLYVVDHIASAHGWTVGLAERSDGESGARFEVKGVDAPDTVESADGQVEEARTD
jgi:PAS domain S-box-containing protein